MEWLSSSPSIILLVLGFGFVIFFHELGHFLAAKWVGIKVEQFAVGFGQAILSWRKGMGVSIGSSGKKLEELKRQEESGVAGIDTGRYGETEYRLNWIPLGGYVKMLGQDDLNPNSQAEDPRAYNKKSIGARMIVVSAGVIMNIILAAIGFMVLFLMGFNAPPAVVGSIAAGSPAQRAGLQVGDRILYFNGAYQHDFTKISLNVALAQPGMPIPIYVEHADGRREHLTIEPEADSATRGFLGLGVSPAMELRGIKTKDSAALEESLRLSSPAMSAVRPGERIVKINGLPLPSLEAANANLKHADQVRRNIHFFDQAIQSSGGKPVELTLEDASGKLRTTQVHPTFGMMFGADSLSFGGMVPRTSVVSLITESVVKEKIEPGDVILAVSDSSGQKSNPSAEELKQWLDEAGHRGEKVSVKVLRDGKTLAFDNITLGNIGNRHYGLGVGLGFDDQHPVVAQILTDSAAAKAQIPAGATLTAINGQPVRNWFDVQRTLASSKANQPIEVAYAVEGDETRSATIDLSAAELTDIQSHRYTLPLLLQELIEPRQTNNPALAAWWGVVETRDFVLQFYLTLKRMVQGTISYTNMMGPVGIFVAGTHFADKGTDWLIWFLAMISANLAVVNFLPIPIVDGGLFTFLIIEKIQGKPLSARTQSIAQIVGLAILVSVFLLVTYQDITRHL
ncbi:MAG: site-2 protease family protein [Phycisphaerales bacterium]|nr:site-2 protease family protein [Phycisphaerales bacterium]